MLFMKRVEGEVVSLPAKEESGFSREKVNEARLMAVAGFSTERMAELWGVYEGDVERWKRSSLEFRNAVESGRIEVVLKVIEALVKKCVGYSEVVEKVVRHGGTAHVVKIKEYYPPETEAIKLFMTLFCSDMFDVGKVKGGGKTTNILNLNFNPKNLTEAELKQLNDLIIKAKNKLGDIDDKAESK